MTMIEVLTAAVVALVIFTILMNLLSGTGTVQARNQLQISVDDSIRSSLELMASDLRQSVGPRIIVSGSPGLPSGLASYASGSTALSVVQIPSATLLSVMPPGGYPTTTTFSNVTSTALNASVSACSAQYTSGDYAMLTTETSSSWVQVDASNYCTGGSTTSTLKHTASSLSYTYTPAAVLGEVTVMRYAVQTVNGLSALTRQQVGGPVQTVAYDITGLTVEYSADGYTFSSTPVQPKAIRLTLTGSRSAGSKNSSLTLSTTVYMRDVQYTAPGN
ncbi:hypothetical protein E7T09_10080 [Deinococcus sp. KSM4-11]|uniref:PulJ/GspJ family protein n=1 Tax=Deinococcus sp. KSM4-11 TaxID=2568654 RepID=UPI0010A4C3D7|nr:hypothetical protein [Deinococcus sp. KSM4-11]THF86466.1 hypothetical protein E7T09_10080 [Deinococcus sp. KSM4-11]